MPNAVEWPSHTGPAGDCEADSDVAPIPKVYPVSLPPALIDDDAAKVIRRLSQHGHTAYLVGGGVRDLLLERRPKDFDVATSARPSEVRRLFRNCRIIGRRFRLAHVLFSGGKIIEVATFRCDPKGGEDRDNSDDLLIRHDNVFGQPHEDAIRRDFTVNGMFYDLARSEVIDYVDGMPDLEARLVRTIGAADRRIREDPVRMLRAIKFAARLGMTMETSLYETIVQLRTELQRSARPRVLEEIFRLLRGGAGATSLQLCWEMGVLAVVFPELAAFLDDDVAGREQTWACLHQIDADVQRGQIAVDAVLLTALLTGAIEEALAGSSRPGGDFDVFFAPIAQRLALPRRLKDTVRALVGSQYALRAGRIDRLAHREFFPAAVQLFVLQRLAAGVTVPDWVQRPGLLDNVQSEARPPKRRRRRRRDAIGS